MPTDQSTQKSSNEILTELFSAFNAEPPTGIVDEVESKKERKKKKNKKTKKKKNKKHKRKRSLSICSEDANNEKKKSKKVKKLEVPMKEITKALDDLLDRYSKKSTSDDEERLEEDEKSENGFDLTPVKQEKLGVNEENESELVNECEKDEHIQYADEERDKHAVVFEESEQITQADLYDKKKRKILIPNLKNSAVFQETIREVEEKQKKEEEKRARYEEGEISESSGSSDNESDAATPKKESHRKESRNKRSPCRSDHKGSSKRHRRSHSRSRHRSPKSKLSPRYSGRSRESRHYPGHRDYLSGRHDRYSSRGDRHERSRVSQSSRERKEKSKSSRDRSKNEAEVKKFTNDRHRERSKSKSTESQNEDKIDKKKLLAIARKNAKKLIEAGIVSADKLSSAAVGGKTVNELTEYCKKLASREGLGEDVSDIDSGTSDEDDRLFHHPFQVRDRPNSIVMNIKNAIALPTRSLQEKAAEQSKQLRLMFPVSSGSTHRLNESEWVPVEPEPEVKVLKPTSIVPPLPPLPPLPPPAVASSTLGMPLSAPLSAVPPPPIPAPVFPIIQPTVYETAQPGDAESLDINDIVSKRLSALRQLQENPKDWTAKQQISRTQNLLDQWMRTEARAVVGRKPETGEFKGSTGARILSSAELNSGTQAWAKRDQLMTAQPVSGGMGMALLQKMGWQPGEGLGKNKEGTLEPLRLEVKMDKKGLVASDEARVVKNVGPALPTVKTLDGKHPVSLLNEYCNRRRWGQPYFELAFECGPDHKKNFLFKVKVNGVEYQPSVASVNKKQAKAEAAAIALRALGLISDQPSTSA